MSKCENCLSKNVCRWYANGEGKNLCCADDFHCPEQKDKDLFIRTPCKVGDTVWMIWATTNNKLEIVKREVVRDTVKSFTIEASGDAYFETERSCFYAEHIGKRVFHTKEEAERALKERDNNADR